MQEQDEKKLADEELEQAAGGVKILNTVKCKRCGAVVKMYLGEKRPCPGINCGETLKYLKLF